MATAQRNILLIWFTILVVYVTWSPFTFRAPFFAFDILPRRAAHDVIGNLFLLVPIAAIIARHARKRPILTATLCACAMSVIVETGQFFVTGRIVALSDVVLNTAGAALGAAAFARLVWPMFAVAYAIMLATALYSSVTFQRGMRLSGWDAGYEIAVGDEVQTDRRYFGAITRAEICAGDRSPICATANAPRALREQVVATAQRTQGLRVRAQVVSQSDEQLGPTRIITFSRGAYQRNVTLGQHQTHLVLRLRTPLNGQNGRDYEVWVPNAVTAGVPTDIELIFDHGALRGVVETATHERRFSVKLDALSGGVLFGMGGKVSIDGVWRIRLATAIVLLFPLALLIAPRNEHLPAVKRLRVASR